MDVVAAPAKEESQLKRQLMRRSSLIRLMESLLKTKAKLFPAHDTAFLADQLGAFAKQSEMAQGLNSAFALASEAFREREIRPEGYN